MLRVGLTGGIGSGKTLASDHFAELGVPVIDTDVLAHRLVRTGSPALREIEKAFGTAVIQQDGALDRSAMRNIVFRDPAARRVLESILHPAIRREVERQVARLDHSYCIIVVPLLVESGFTDLADRVLVVDAEPDDRKRWVGQRNGLPADEIERIFAAQATREQRLAAADDVIHNDGSIEDLRRKVESLDRNYRRIAEQRQD